MENLEIFEKACKYFSDNISEFKEILSEKIPTLNDKDWEFDKGSTKVFKADETGRKKRCKTGIAYLQKLMQKLYGIILIYFLKKHIQQILKEFPEDIKKLI